VDEADTAWRLTVTFDLRAPTVTLSIDGHPHTVAEVSLVLLRETVGRSMKRPGGVVPESARQSYRLRFAFDACEGEPPTPSGHWPGLCGYFDGGPPRQITRYELLVDVDSLYSWTQDVHQFEAACVPTSGAGPTCHLGGTKVILYPWTEDIHKLEAACVPTSGPICHLSDTMEIHRTQADHRKP
jgi:hypothetical protein